jgi:hypothetical protein
MQIMHAWAFPGIQLHVDASDALRGVFPAKIENQLYSHKAVEKDKADRHITGDVHDLLTFHG